MSNVSLGLLIFSLTVGSVLAACPAITGRAQGYNISALDLEFITLYGTSSFYINVCGGAPSCQGSAGCYTTGAGDVSTLGDVASVEGYQDYLNITLATPTLSTHITLLCGNSLGRPEVQHKTPGHIFMVWESVAACRNSSSEAVSQVPCYTYDSDTRQLYDMGDLVGNNYHVPVVNSNVSVYFSLCGPVTGENSCQGGAVCYKTGTSTHKIGTVTRGPSVTDDGVIVSYTQSNPDSDKCPEIVVTVVMICTPHKQTPPSLIYSGVPCTYHILWRTDHACPIQPIHDVGCRLQAPSRSYDLTPLVGRDYTVSLAEHNYVLSVCSNIGTKCKGEDASGCIVNTQDYDAWSMGSYHEGNLVWDDTGLTMIYNGGTACSSGQVRSTKILFVCDKNVNEGVPEITEENYCFYSFIWRTKYACPVQQGETCAKYGTDGEMYDISILSYRSWQPIPASTEDLLLSVCGDMVECPGASLCRKNSTGTYLPLASRSEHFNINADKSIMLTYEGAGVCENQPTSLTVEMTCKQGSTSAPPMLLSAAPCDYIVAWETGAACPSHSASGTQCKLVDTVTGLTFDLNSLAGQSFTVPVGEDGRTITLQLCGSLPSSPCGEGVSACRSDGTVLGYTDSNGFSSSKLVYEDRSLAMPLEGGVCEEGLNYTTIIEFLCDTEKRELAGYKFHNCSHYIMFSDPSFCPIYPMECAVSNSTNSYDLSPLYDAGNLAWAGTLNGTQTALYVRACGQITLGTEGCDHTAGVCAVILNGDTGDKVSLNLGRTSSDLTITNNIISETYHNGDRVCTDSKLRATTRVEYSCAVNTESQIEAAVFNDEMCLYVVEISSPYGCLDREVESPNCTITDPNTGVTYDFSFLSSDASFTNANSHFQLHVCGALDAGCGEDAGAGACEVVNGNFMSLGKSTTSQLSLVDDIFTLTYTGGEECAPSKEGTPLKQTEITFICNKDVKVGEPRYINKDSESCVYHFEWELAAACPPLRPSCRVIDSQLREYDLSILRSDSSWMLRHEGKVYYLNVCGESSACGDNSAFCSVEGADNKKTSLGRVSGEPQMQEGYIELTYYHGDKCGAGGRLWTTTVLFFCETQSESLPTIVVNEAICEVTVEWRTLHACPAAYAVGHNCSVTNPVTGVTYDLWKLSNRNYTTAVSEHTYTYSFCTPMTGACNELTTGGACQYSSLSQEAKMNGQVNTTVTYSNGVLILHYNDGNVCSRGDIRETTIKMICDHALSDVEVAFEEVNETSHCVYETFAFSGLPCDKEVLYECEIDGYDITALALTRDNYYSQSGPVTFSMNVCRGVNIPSPCSSNTAVCMRQGADKGVSLGEVESAELVYEDSNLKLKYIGADICRETGSHYKSYITFFCAADDTVGTPQYLSNSSCSFNFIWTTKFACRDRLVADSCKIKDTISGETVLDLSPLKNRGTYSLTPQGTSDTYSVSICGSLPDSECKADTAVCARTSDPATQYTSQGVMESDTKISSAGERGPVTLTYLNGDICTKTDGTSVPYHTVIEFTCPASQTDDDMTIVSQDNCALHLSLPTSLVCHSDTLACDVVRDGHVIDLSSLASSSTWLVSNRITMDGNIFISVCKTLPEVDTSGCPKDSSACYQPTSDPNAAVDLGHVAGPLQVDSDGNIELLYTDGASCIGGIDGKISTRITFICDKTAPSMPFLDDFSECEYSITWATPLACTEDVEPVNSCTITDPDTGFQYDLTTLTRDSEYYQEKLSSAMYLLNVCGSVDTCGSGVAVCKTPLPGMQGQKISLGKANTMTTSLEQERGEVKIAYSEGDPCPEDGTRKLQSTVLIICCSGGDNELTLISQLRQTDSCRYGFILCSPKICQFSPKECNFKLGANVYDFSPLSRRYDNWVTTVQDADVISEVDDRTFYLNPCRGINTDSKTRGCAENSIGCVAEKSVLGSESLGLIETRVQHIGSNASTIVLNYSSGSTNICSGHGARTQISFTCANQLGEPRFIDNKDCTYKFSWSTFAACNASSRPVTSSTCRYEHPLTHSQVDLAGTEGYFTTNSSVGVVYFSSCGGALPGGSLEKGSCEGASVCVKDLRNGMVSKFSTERMELFARDDSAELVLSSTKRCEDSVRKTWKAIVEYTCSEDGSTSAYYRSISHCHVLVGVRTPAVCSQPAKRDHYVNFLTALILVLCGVFAALLLLYICFNSHRRSKILRKLRSLLPVRGARAQTMAYKRLRTLRSDDSGLLSDSDEEIVGL